MIEVRDLVKKYGDNVAVDHLSFTVNKGQIMGFLGPNGAGKSTTMNMITGYISATDGTVTIDGHEILEEPEEAKKRIGYLPEQPPLYMDMKVSEYLKFVSELKGVRKNDRAAMIDDIMQKTKLVEMSERLIRHLSKGYKQRVGLAGALIGYPDVIILDEPTVGLDPMQIIEIRDLIKSLAKDHTVILSSHILSEVSAICDIVLIINKGKLVVIDTPDQLSKHLEGGCELHLVIKGSQEEINEALSQIKGIQEVKFSETEEVTEAENMDDVTENFTKDTRKQMHNVIIAYQDCVDMQEQVFYALAKAKCPIYEMQGRNMSLEDIFLELTKDSPTQQNKITVEEEDK